MNTIVREIADNFANQAITRGVLFIEMQGNSRGENSFPRAEMLNSVAQIRLAEDNVHLFDLNVCVLENCP